MEDQKQFFLLLKPLRRQLLMNKMITEAHFGLLAAAVLSVAMLAAARLFVIPFYHEMIFYSWFLLFPIFSFRIWRQRPMWKDAATIFNSYIPEDRVLTTLSFIQEKGIIPQLQRAETVRMMKAELERVISRKRQYFLPKWLFAVAVTFGIAALLNFFPNQTQQLANQEETKLAILKKVEKELEKKAMREKSPETKQALLTAQEMLAKKPDVNDALKKLVKQQKELELKLYKAQQRLQKLTDWQKSLEQAGLNQLASALEKKDEEKVRQELEKLKQQTLTEQQKKALSQLNGASGEFSKQELAELMKQVSEALEAEKMMAELFNAQTTVAQAVAQLQQEMAANGIKPGQFAVQSSPAAPTGKTNTNTGNPSKQSAGGNQGGKQSPAASGKGNSRNGGSGSGQVTMQNGHSSGGNGRGSGGSGNGAGFGAGSREYLTIPEQIAGKRNVENDNGSIGQGNSLQEFSGDGPVLKGSLRPYEEVYQEYQQTFRNQTERVKLPKDLEELVKNYFLEIDPTKE
ncbi:hypothetical protein [Bacillus rubiinfantis]|uniref:hypothetical protein n=1 Tax=Bacillus rubiinfantis TaxID=1499680 RepID=UPI0005A6173B|nr:hypothetical protein [Bacillus rubiinfantis]